MFLIGLLLAPILFFAIFIGVLVLAGVIATIFSPPNSD